MRSPISGYLTCPQEQTPRMPGGSMRTRISGYLTCPQEHLDDLRSRFVDPLAEKVSWVIRDRSDVDGIQRGPAVLTKTPGPNQTPQMPGGRMRSRITGYLTCPPRTDDLRSRFVDPLAEKVRGEGLRWHTRGLPLPIWCSAVIRPVPKSSGSPRALEQPGNIDPSYPSLGTGQISTDTPVRKFARCKMREK